MKRSTRIGSLAATVACWGLLFVPPALSGGGRGGDEAGPETQSVLEITGFSDDGRRVGVKVSDEEGRIMFQVREVKKGKIKETISILEGQEKKGLRKLKKKGITAEGLGAENAKGITLMSAQKENKLIIYAMKGENCTKKVAEIKLTKVKESKRNQASEAFVKQLTWGPRGKHVAVVYHEEYKQTMWWKGDRFFGFKFKAYKAICSSTESN